MNDQTKSLLHSRTFWFNLIGILLEVTGLLETVGLKPGAALIISNGLNIALRLVTNKAVTPFLTGEARGEQTAEKPKELK